MSRGSGVSDSVDQYNKNVLHLMAAQCMKEDMAALLKVICVSGSRSFAEEITVIIINQVHSR